MDYIGRFFAYAQDFEQTYKDDDWTRLPHYFTENAVYEVKNSPLDCRLMGPVAILQGIRKSVNGFDRKFTVRRVELLSAAEPLPDGLALSWAGTYEKEGVPPVTIKARTEVHYEGDRISHMTDAYEAPTQETLDWFRRYGAEYDGSYF